MADQEFDVWVEDGGADEVEVEAEPVAVEVVEEDVVRVPTLSLPEWKEATASLVKAGLVDKGADYTDVRNALISFQASIGVTGMDAGFPTEATLSALKGA